MRRTTTTVVRRQRRRLAGIALVTLLAAASCGRDDDTDAADDTDTSEAAVTTTTTAPDDTATSTTAPDDATATTTTAAPADEPGPGDFGTIEGLCGPGDASGATARGVTDTEIHIGTLADPSNTIVPGAGQESFDIAEAFAEWCNAAGGINGRQIVVTTRDSALFEVGARMAEACESDFMLVGSANPLDEAGVEPRLGCEMAAIPAYAVSEAAANAGLQVLADNSQTEVLVGPWLAEAAQYPDAFQAVGFIAPDGAGLNAFAERQRAALAARGFTTVSFQLNPITGVDNWRPYVQTVLDDGVRALITLSPDLAAFAQAMSDVGLDLDLMPLGVQNYSAATIDLVGQGLLPTTYVSMTFWPFEAAADNPPTQQAIDLIASVTDRPPTFAHLQALSSWIMFAEAARDCGSELTGQCVIDTAAGFEEWTAGGIRAPIELQVGPGTLSRCFTLLEATADGFVLVPDLTQPNTDVFNCDPANVELVENGG